MEKFIYHGTIKKFSNPTYGLGNKDNDYGLGFYCTEDINLAKEWACRIYPEGYINSYLFNDEGLKILDLTSSNYSILNWIAILLIKRDSINSKKYEMELSYLQKYYINPSEYDVVIGFRADDSYFEFPKAFLDSRLSLECLEETFNLGNLGIQYVLISQKAFERLSFLNSEKVMGYHKIYSERLDDAKNRFNEILDSPRNKLGTTIRELLKHELNN